MRLAMGSGAFCAVSIDFNGQKFKGACFNGLHELPSQVRLLSEENWNGEEDDWTDDEWGEDEGWGKKRSGNKAQLRSA